MNVLSYHSLRKCSAQGTVRSMHRVALPILLLLKQLLITRCWALLASLCFAVLCATQLSAAASSHTIQLAAPLTTHVYAEGTLNINSRAIQAQITLPDNFPSDLGVGAFIKDDDGSWFQLPFAGVLKAGHNHLHFSLAEDAAWQSEPNIKSWSIYQQHLAHTFGLYFWSESQERSQIIINDIRRIQNKRDDSPIINDAADPTTTTDLIKTTDVSAAHYCLHNLEWDAQNQDKHIISIETGTRWEARCQLAPMPSNPYNHLQCSLDLIIRDSKDGRELHFPGFYQQPMRFEDRGDNEIAIENAEAHFAVRFRPMHPGTYEARLIARWYKEEQTSDPAAISNPNIHCAREIRLPNIVVTGDHWDPYVRVDKQDPRFFSYGAQQKQFHWPIGINIRSVTDPRGTARTRSQVTPERGLHAYKAYIDRCARAGVNNAEIWLSSWNLALEWKDQWPGFHGIGMYHEGNAARIDALLDYAWARGIRIIFVINNHGQASTGADAEWENSPYNTRNGGVTRNAADMFIDPVCKAFQYRHRRYLIGRYADHPAILCWKLWTEMNLTRGSRSGLKAWHQAAFADFHRLDHYYQHPCTSHWSGDYNVPDRNLVQLAEMDVIAIDAYHQGHFLPQLLYYSSLHEHRGLAQYNKPLIVTEFGGNWDACPIPQLKAEHASGFWVALMSGHASSPHLWWFEWVDQENLWLPFRAMQRFLLGEDLRNPKARSVKLDLRHANDSSVGNRIWSRAWAQPAYILGYCIDYDWGNHGRAQPLHSDIQIVISKNAKAGEMNLEWWDPSLGTCIEAVQIKHPGGALRISMPPFRRHLAFKLKRSGTSSAHEDSDL